MEGGGGEGLALTGWGKNACVVSTGCTDSCGDAPGVGGSFLFQCGLFPFTTLSPLFVCCNFLLRVVQRKKVDRHTSVHSTELCRSGQGLSAPVDENDGQAFPRSWAGTRQAQTCLAQPSWRTRGRSLGWSSGLTQDHRLRPRPVKHTATEPNMSIVTFGHRGVPVAPFRD